MDNLETNVDPVGEADVTASPGQSTEETQVADVETSPTGDAVDEGTTEATTQSFPWESDERFKGKTPDEMYKIVAEADKYKGVLSQKAKVADMLSQQYGITPEKMAEIIQQKEEQAKQAYYEENPLAPFQDKIQTLEQKIAQQETQAIIQQEDAKLASFLQEKPEFAPFKEEIRRLGYTIDRDSSWDQIADRYFGKAINYGQENAYKKMGVKQQTQAAGVSRGEVKSSMPTLEEMRNMSSAELEAILRSE